MVRFGQIILQSNKSAVLVSLLAVFAIAGLAIASRLHAEAGQVSKPSIQTINSGGSSPNPISIPSNSSDPSEESNLSAADSSTANNGSQSSVTVNGQTIPVPQNGSVSQTLNSNGGATTVDVQHQSSSSSQADNSSHSSSSLQVNVNSHSSSSEDSP